ncbi:MAG: fatty acid desaturase [Hymenobacter sp.]
MTRWAGFCATSATFWRWARCGWRATSPGATKPRCAAACCAARCYTWVFTLALACVNLPATLAVFVGPFVLSRVIMMMGNWAQHAFVDADSPDNCYTNSVTCINTNYNHKCWNDGYHISHHLKPALHWTDHPAHFRKNLAAVRGE